MFTIFVSYAEYAFPVVYALMTRKTKALYKAVLEKVRELVPEFQPSHVVADFEVREVFGDQVTVSGCWRGGAAPGEGAIWGDDFVAVSIIISCKLVTNLSLFYYCYLSAG